MTAPSIETTHNQSAAGGAARARHHSCARPAQTRAASRGGKRGARKRKRAQILLAVDRGASDEEIARSIGVGGSTVYRTKRRFVLGNLVDRI